MNALRWNPLGTSAGFINQITLTAATTYPKYTQLSPLVLRIQLAYDPSQNGPSAVSLPYSNSADRALCPYTILGASKAVSISNAAFGLFDSSSPIRLFVSK